MFRGRKCSERCKNSLNILQRQDKAAKLLECQCDANEQIDSFKCSDIKRNMEELCFEPEETTTVATITTTQFEIENEIDVDNKVSSSSTKSEVQNLAVIIIVCLMKYTT